MESESDDPRLPRELEHALGRAFAPDREARAEIARRLAPAARERMAELSRQRAPVRPLRRPWMWRGAAAAAVLATLGVWYTRWSASSARECGPDFDGNGRIDVLDAFHVARGIASGTARAEWDFDGNGRVDRGDADELARRAVKVRS
jgi:hypothetical protein